MNSKTKFTVFLVSIIGIMGVVLYLDATDNKPQAEQLATAVFAGIIVVLIAVVLFGKKKVVMPAAAAPAPTIKQYSFY